MIEIARSIPDADVLLAMEPEEIAGHILLAMKKRSEHVHAGNSINDLFGREPAYARSYQRDIERAVMEAFAWLEAAVLIVPEAGTNGSSGWRILSRRAEKMQTAADFASFRAAQELPRALLHPRIATQVWLSFIRGEYEAAVFQAMKAVEVAVRDAAGLRETDIGVALMRSAFDKETGPLSDPATLPAEREALAHLFAGAIGSYKNPHSHRNVPLTDPAEAAETVILASHLLRIVDDRQRRFRS